MSDGGAPSVFHTGWSVQKSPNDPVQNEDAWFVGAGQDQQGAPLAWIAVSDGATESVYSGEWARSLVQSADPLWPALSPEDLDGELQKVRERFVPVPPGEEVPWYARTKFVTEGSQATLLAATISPVGHTGAAVLRAVAVGDSSLLLLRSSGQLESFPVTSSREFGTRPDLVRNRRPNQVQIHRLEWALQSGDIVLACTDAIGKWVLECFETERGPMVIQAVRGILAGDVTVRADVEEVGEVFEAHEEEPHPSGLQLLSDLVRRLTHRSEPRARIEAAPAPRPPLQPLTFDDFVTERRQNGSVPKMRNDDSTLVVFALVEPSRDGRQQLLEMFERASAGTGPETAARNAAAPREVVARGHAADERETQG